MKIVAFYNFKGGVGSTTYTKHTCIRAKEHGLDVVGASLGHLHDLQHHGQSWHRSDHGGVPRLASERGGGLRCDGGCAVGAASRGHAGSIGFAGAR